MNRTYRALAIVAVVAPLVSIGSLLLSSYVTTHGLIPQSPPTGARWIPAIALPIFWAPAISSLAAPVIATFAAVVAAESQRWSWLVAFIALGAFGVIGLVPFATSAPLLTAPYDLTNAVGVIGPHALLIGYSPMLLLAIVALVFALLPHGASSTSASVSQVTGRALAIVVVVATLVSLISIAWSTHNEYAATGASFSPIGLPILLTDLSGTTQLVLDVTSLWDPIINGLAAPVVATLAIIVAAQGRRWRWLALFIALSVLCALGPALAPELSFGGYVRVNQSTAVLISPPFYQIVPMLLLAIVALIFAALSAPRAAEQTEDGIERAALAAD